MRSALACFEEISRKSTSIHPTSSISGADGKNDHEQHRSRGQVPRQFGLSLPDRGSFLPLSRGWRIPSMFSSWRVSPDAVCLQTATSRRVGWSPGHGWLWPGRIWLAYAKQVVSAPRENCLRRAAPDHTTTGHLHIRWRSSSSEEVGIFRRFWPLPQRIHWETNLQPYRPAVRLLVVPRFP